MNQITQLSDLQISIMLILWQRKEATVAQIHSDLQNQRPLAMTTVATVLSRLERRGLIAHRSEGRQYIYRPLISENETRKSIKHKFKECIVLMIKKAFIFSAICACLFLSCSLTTSSTSNLKQNEIVHGELGAKINEYMSRITAFGFSGALLVAKEGEIILQKGYGLADRARNLPVTTESVFTIGSITKQFTGTAILKLEMQGKLSVNDPISEFFNNVPQDKANITIHHLLTHSAGLESDYGNSDFEEVSRDEIIRRVLNAELRSKPGERYHYSNAGYSLLGAIIEITSGQSYEAYLNEHLFKPAGMSKSGYLIPKWNPDDIAQGYVGEKHWGTVLERPWASDGPYWNLRANGGIHSTIVDMYKWHLALEGEAVLSKEAKHKLFASHIPEDEEGSSYYGYGWAIFKTDRGTKLIAHNGGNGIFFADFRRYVDEDVVIIIMSNVADSPAEYVSPNIARIVFGLEYTLPPKITKIDYAALTKYEGRYRLPSGAKIKVSSSHGSLMLAGEDQDAFSLLASGDLGDQKLFNELNVRTTIILKKRSEGDYRPLHEAFGGRLSLNQIESMAKETWQELQENYGTFNSFKVLGTTSGRGRRAITSVQLDFEHGSEIIQYIWIGDMLRGIRFADSPPKNVFWPQSKTDFASFSLMSPNIVHISFEIDNNGSVKGLTVHGKRDNVFTKIEK